MKDDKKGLPLALQIVITLVVFVGLFPLFDMAWCKFISHSTFQYKLFDHVILPLLMGSIFSTIMVANQNKSNKNK